MMNADNFQKLVASTQARYEAYCLSSEPFDRQYFDDLMTEVMDTKLSDLILEEADSVGVRAIPDGMVASKAQQFFKIVNTLHSQIVIQDHKLIVPNNVLWGDLLKNKEALLKNAILASGRIEYDNVKKFGGVGTGWFVTKDIIVTNKHVADLFKNNQGRIDMREEYKRPNVIEEFKFKQLLYIDPTLEVAFIKIDVKDKVISPIKLARNYDYTSKDVIAAIGYPEHEQGFEMMLNDRAGKKHLHPGTIVGHGGHQFQHDCSVSACNSGSVIVNTNTGEAVGIHFGDSDVVNYAVKAEKIRELAKTKLNITL